MLKSEILPLSGGDTIFVDTIAAYEGLSNVEKAIVRGLTGHFTYLKFRDFIPGLEGTKEEEFLKKGVDHPLITTHPEIGNKLLLVSFNP